MSVLQKIHEQLPSIMQKMKAETQELNKVLPELREHLISTGQIIKYEHQPAPTTSMVAVDGAKVVSPLTGTDLMLAVATSGDAHQTPPAYPEGEKPEEVWVNSLAHKTNNEEITSDVMAALEMRVLAQTKSGTRIIDGAYIGNVSTLLFPLTTKIDPDRIDTVLEGISLDNDHTLRNIINEILYPSRDNSSNIIALPKSDTAKVYAKEYLRAHPRILETMPDRILATRLLHGGEMLTPRVIRSNPVIIENLQRLDLGTYANRGGKHVELYHDLLKDKDGLLRRLDNTPTEEGILHAAYFKPHVALPESKAMKVEYPHYTNSAREELEYAQNIVSLIDSDIIDGYILEPWCQYIADREAKEISAATNMIKNEVVANSDDTYEIVGFTRGYRT